MNFTLTPAVPQDYQLIRLDSNGLATAVTMLGKIGGKENQYFLI